MSEFVSSLQDIFKLITGVCFCRVYYLPPHQNQFDLDTTATGGCLLGYHVMGS